MNYIYKYFGSIVNIIINVPSSWRCVVNSRLSRRDIPREYSTIAVIIFKDLLSILDVCLIMTGRNNGDTSLKRQICIGNGKKIYLYIKFDVNNSVCHVLKIDLPLTG